MYRCGSLVLRKIARSNWVHSRGTFLQADTGTATLHLRSSTYISNTTSCLVWFPHALCDPVLGWSFQAVGLCKWSNSETTSYWQCRCHQRQDHRLAAAFAACFGAFLQLCYCVQNQPPRLRSLPSCRITATASRTHCSLALWLSFQSCLQGCLSQDWPKKNRLAWFHVTSYVSC